MRGSHMENIIQSACPPIKSEPDFSNDDDDKQHVQLQNFQFVEVDGEEILKSEIDIYEETFSTEMKVFKSERKDVPSPVCNSDQIKVQELLKSETDICEKMIGTKLRAFKSETKDDPYTMCSSDHIKIGTLKSEIDICEETFGTESEVFVSKTRDDPSLMCSSDQIKIISTGSSNTGNFMLEIQDNITCRSLVMETQLEKELSAESVNMPTLEFENICIRFLVCPFCESVFSSPEELASHQLNCNFVRRVPVITAKPHSECKSQFPCPFCNKILDSIIHFNCHLLSHTEEPVFKCRRCNITFQDNRMLVEHLKIHTFIHSFMCDICGKPLSSKYNLKYHKRLHTGECPFSCKLCGKTFMKKSYLDRHSLSHTGKEPYTCDHCGMSFYKKVDIIYHIRHNHIVSHTQRNAHLYACSVTGHIRENNTSITR